MMRNRTSGVVVLGRARRFLRPAACTLTVIAAMTVAACGGSSSPAGVQGGSEVTAQGVATPGPNPFTPPVGKDTPGLRPPPAAVNT
jgi:hypothetical protein